MMKTATIPMNKGSLAAEFLGRTFLYQNNYLIILSAFLLGSTNIAGIMLPFGAAYYAAVKGSAGKKLLTAAAVLAGAAIRGSLQLVYLNAACMLLFSVFGIPLKESKEPGIKLEIKPAVIFFMAVLFPSLILDGLQGFLLYDILKTLVSSFIAFVLFFIFGFSLPLMDGTVKRGRFTGEEAISIAVTAILIISGIGSIQVLGFSIRNILCLTILLLFSFSCGAGVGSAAGTVVGLLICIASGSTPSLIGAYALCGMLGGVLGKLGRAGTALGFLMGNLILAAFLNGAAETTFQFKEIVATIIIYFILPRGWVNKITTPFAGDALQEDRKGYYSRIRDITVERLEKFSKAFLDISKTFGEIAETKVSTERQDINVLFDRVADRICSDCSLCMHCWERNFYDTYQVMFKIVESLETKGRVEESDIPGYFLDKCARINDFVNTVNNMYELFRVGLVWKSKLSESRGVISRQFEGMSRVISELAGEINTEVRFMKPQEDDIRALLDNSGVKVKEVIVYKNVWDKYIVNVVHGACGGARVCISVVEKIVSESIGRRMTRESEDCSKDRDGNCNLRLVEAENLKLTTGIARLPKYGSNVSGDSFSFLNSGNGKYTLALSDGMGTGNGASAQSRSVVNMLESFLESGFDKDMAVSLINSVLVLKSNEDTTCTIDMSAIDLFNGDVEFVKIGAAPTYIKRDDKVDIVRSASLPAGILPGIDAELAHRSVGGGDMIIMVTDGIIDSLAGDEPGDRQLMKFIQQLESLNPQQVADSILAEADSCCNGKPCDDLTVLVAKVWKKLR